MIVENQLIEVFISNNAQYYKQYGYTGLTQGTVIFVPPCQLPTNSQKKVKCICDACGCVFDRQYQQVCGKNKTTCQPCSRKYVGELNRRDKPNKDVYIPKTNSEIKDWVLCNCVSKKNRIITHSTRIEWFHNNWNMDLYNTIINRTSYMNDGVSFLVRYYDILHDITDKQVCIICGKSSSFINSSSGYSKYCSVGCSYKDSELNSHKSSRLADIIFKRYGVSNASKLQFVKDKISKKLKGVKKNYQIGNHPSHRNLTDDQIDILKNLDGVYKTHIEYKIPITTLSEQYGFSKSTLFNALTRNNYSIMLFSGSMAQRKLYNWLVDSGYQCEFNAKSYIGRKEIDIYLNDYKIGIEVNGLYWHRDNLQSPERRYNLLEKSKLADNHGIRILHFFDTEIDTKFEIVKSIILAATGNIKTKYYARKCNIMKISPAEAFEFWKTNHLQPPIYTANNYALNYEGTIVSVIGISKSRTSDDMEIVRFASRLNSSVIGGFNKLVNYVVNTMNISTNLISFVDSRIFTGKSYSKNFIYEKTTSPNYFYFSSRNYMLQSRYKFQKHKLKRLYDNGTFKFYDESLSEYENMRLNGYYRIYDCGNKLYRYKNQTGDAV